LVFTNSIQKNKGKVIGSIADADYVILFTRSQTFQGLLSEAQACDKIPLQSAFVTDCVAENVLLDETSYALDTGVSIKSRRGRQGVFFDLVPAEVPLSVKKEKPVSDMKPKPKAKKAVPAETPTKKVTKRLAPTSSKISAAPSSKDVKSARARRSPTPPPPETRKSMKDGKFYFTDPELLYFCRYAQFLLNEDPTMSTAALLQAVHKKVRDCLRYFIRTPKRDFAIDATSFSCIVAGAGVFEIENATDRHSQEGKYRVSQVHGCER